MLAIQKEHFCFLRKLRLNIEDDLYGYEGAQLCNSLSDNVITLTAGNMYRALYRLEDVGVISKRKMEYSRLTQIAVLRIFREFVWFIWRQKLCFS